VSCFPQTHQEKLRPWPIHRSCPQHKPNSLWHLHQVSRAQKCCLRRRALSAGDQLLAADDASFVNVTQQRAAMLVCKSGPVTLTIGKEAAYFHDLEALLKKSPLKQLQQNIHCHSRTCSPLPTSLPSRCHKYKMANFIDTTDTDYSIVSDDIVYDVIGLNFKFY